MQPQIAAALAAKLAHAAAYIAGKVDADAPRDRKIRTGRRQGDRLALVRRRQTRLFVLGLDGAGLRDDDASELVRDVQAWITPQQWIEGAAP